MISALNLKLMPKNQKSELSHRTKTAKPVTDKILEPHNSSVNDGTDSDESVDIEKLRQGEKLKSKAKKILKKLGLTYETSSSESGSEGEQQSDVSYFSDDDSEAKKQKSKDIKKKKKSGTPAKASDRVKFPQWRPQAYLQFEYVNKQLKFDELDFKQFIAGETEIISEADMLKKIVYYSAIYEFRGLKAFYAAWVRDIERGKKKWSDPLSVWLSVHLSLA